MVFSNKLKSSCLGKKRTFALTFTPYVKINSKRIIGLNVRAKTVKLLEKHTGENLETFGLEKNSWDTEITNKKKQLDFTKI